jgi:hypothetical protein
MEVSTKLLHDARTLMWDAHRIKPKLNRMIRYLAHFIESTYQTTAKVIGSMEKGI